MDIKKLIMSVCFFLSFTVIGVNAEFTTITGKINFKASEKTCSEYTYVRVFADGQWWIYVYLDGSLILVLPDAEEG